MAINPINYAMVQRANDVGTIKHNEDTKPMVNQQNIQVQVEKREDMLRHQVIDPKNNNRSENEADAREEGKGRYFNNRKPRKKNTASAKDDPKDKVIRKEGAKRFDISV